MSDKEYTLEEYKERLDGSRMASRSSILSGIVLAIVISSWAGDNMGFSILEGFGIFCLMVLFDNILAIIISFVWVMYSGDFESYLK